jgi:toxin-antitoxin system PIN domain toxin
VIVPDVNLLIHAYSSESPAHEAARPWWEGLLNGSQPVGLPWVSMLGFIRVSTHRQIFANPLPVATACAHVRAWLAQPAVTVLDPGPRHAEILFRLLESLGTAGNLTTDAHLAALAIEHQAELHSTDADFARFPGLRWSNPLA